MSNHPKTPGAMVLDRELIDRIAKQRTPADWGAAIDELRATLAANPEANSPCPECGGSLSTWGCTCTPRWPMHKPADHIEDARAMVEQTPASPMAEHIRQAMIADGSQEGVNIAEGRFGKAMAALCVQLDGQTPAVGGDPVAWMVSDKGISKCYERFPHWAADYVVEPLYLARSAADSQAISLVRRMIENFDTEINCHEDVDPNDREHDQIMAEMRNLIAKLNP